MLDMHAKTANTTPAKPNPTKLKPTSDVWESMGLDDKLSEKAVGLRKATGKMMDEIDD